VASYAGVPGWFAKGVKQLRLTTHLYQCQKLKTQMGRKADVPYVRGHMHSMEVKLANGYSYKERLMLPDAGWNIQSFLM
jgi:hypothetical protein